MTITRTFATTVAPTYTALAIVEVCHFRDMTFDADERVAIYLDTANAIYDLGSLNIGKFPNLSGDESEIEESLALAKAESESNKIGLRILQRKNNTGNWTEIAEFILMNYGRKNYLDMRGRLGYPAKLMEQNDALAVQLVDYGDGLLWDTDFIKVDFAATVEIEKKNNLTALTARISALELALEGKLTNLPANSLLGKNELAGTVEVIPRSNFVDTTTNQSIAGAKVFSGSIQVGAGGNNSSSVLIDSDRIEMGANNGISPSATWRYIDFHTSANAIDYDSRIIATGGGAANGQGNLRLEALSINITGFTALGDNVAIKKKLLSGVTASTQGGLVVVAHGLNATKIISVMGLIYYSTSGVVPLNGRQVNYASIFSTDATNFSITNEASNSAGILSKPFYAVIEYIA